MVPKRKLDGNMRNYFLFILEKMGLNPLFNSQYFFAKLSGIGPWVSRIN